MTLSPYEQDYKASLMREEKRDKKEKRFHQIGGLLVSWLFVAILIALAIFIPTSIMISNHVSGWFQRIGESADAAQMGEYLDRVISGVEELGIQTGYTSLIIRVPENDLGVDYQIFKANRERLKEVQKFPVGSMDYAESLDDIRHQLVSQTFNPLSGFVLNKMFPLWLLFYNPVVWNLYIIIAAVGWWLTMYRCND